MNIDSIQNGYVIDHIRAGRSMEIYHYLGLDALDCSVAIIKNAKSQRMGKKDIIPYTPGLSTSSSSTFLQDSQGVRENSSRGKFRA